LFEAMRCEWIKLGKRDELVFPTHYFGHGRGRIPRTIDEFNEEVECCGNCQGERALYKDAHCHAHMFAAVVLGVKYI
jgi:hypothetical protein